MFISYTMLRLAEARLVEGREYVHGDLAGVTATLVVASGRSGWDGDGHNRGELTHNLALGIAVWRVELESCVPGFNWGVKKNLLLGSFRPSLSIMVFSHSWKQAMRAFLSVTVRT